MIKIPEKYYVGVRSKDADGSIPLGFATPHGTDSAFNKRKSTVDSWCNLGHKTNPGTIQLVDNVLVEGFRISRSIKRTSSWNGGNVVWRVEDPRGFELEIQSGNFAKIVECTTITEGIIHGKCLWGREGSTNILLPEASEPYQEALKFTSLSKKTVSKKSLAVGQRVRMKDDRIAYYLGDYYGFGVEFKRPYNSTNNYSSYSPVEMSTMLTPKLMNKRCAFLLEAHLKDFDATGDFSKCRLGIFSYADIKNVAEILEGDIVVDQQVLMAEIARHDSGYSHFVFPGDVCAVSTSAFKKVEFKLIDGAVEHGVWLMEDPKGRIKHIHSQSFHVEDSNYTKHKDNNTRKLWFWDLPFDIQKMKLGHSYTETVVHPREDRMPALMSSHFDDWKPKTLVAVIDGALEIPVTVKHYGRTAFPLTELHHEKYTP